VPSSYHSSHIAVFLATTILLVNVRLVLLPSTRSKFRYDTVADRPYFLVLRL